MTVDRLNEKPLRSTEHFLVWAFVISLSLHLLGYGGFAMGHKLGWWNKDLMPSWLKSTKERLAELQKLHPKPPPKEEPQLVFVEVDPNAAPVEAPKDTKNYSSRNSRAANKTATTDTQTPKFDGQQKHVNQAIDSQPSKAAPLQPTPPKTAPEHAEVKPKPASQPVGDLAFAKPTPSPNPADTQPQPDPAEASQPVHVRPRRLSEVVSPQTTASQKIKQEGGLKARLDTDSFDAKGTPFGEYDWKLVQAIRDRWFKKLDEAQYSRDRTGRVVIEFRLHSNGQITGMNVVNSEVNDLLTYLCKNAISDPAPYEPWPGDMRRYFGADYRDVQFTFWYE